VAVSERHDWAASFEHRIYVLGECPVCRKSQVGRSLAVARPWLLDEWHPTKNRPLDPATLSPQSPIPVWWRCRNDPP
jgi:hypothetical protein